MQDNVEMIRVERPTLCGCGEGLRPGERAGWLGESSEPLCLWCLADLQAGRSRPRRRAGATPWPAPVAPHRIERATTVRAAPARPRRSATGVTVILALLFTVGALYVRPLIFGTSTDDVVVGGVAIPLSDVSGLGNPEPLTGTDPTDTSGLWPPAPADASSVPLGTPPPTRSSSTDFAFMSSIPELGGRPVAWDPCRPIHLVLNNAQAPAGSDALLREAADSVSSATGLQFVIDGPTTEAPTSNRSPLATSLYGDQWAPVLLAWTEPAVVPRLQGDVAGVAGPVGAPYYVPTQQHWVSGTVYLDGLQFSDLLQSPNGESAARAIVMHELGHLVGLDHTLAQDQLMFERNNGQTAFARGDQEGLRQLGLGPCFTS